MSKIEEKMKVYISIPITGHDIQTVREKADRIKAMLSRAGHTPVSPLDIYAGKNPTYDDHICYDLLAMLDCDALLQCKGWEDSMGCVIEYQVATDYANFGRKLFKRFRENDDDTIQYVGTL